MATVVYTPVTGTATTETISAGTITFSYLKKAHVEVRISGAGDSLATFKGNLKTGITALVQNTDYTIADGGDITFVTATLADGSVYQVEVRRNSNIDERYVDFVDGSVVTEKNLDDAQKQQIYLTQELETKVAEKHEDGTISANLADGVTATTQSASDNSTKVATTAYVDTQLETSDTLGELTDVTLTSPADGSLLLYDTGTSTWRDGAMSGDATISDTGAITVATLNQDTTGNAATVTTNANLTGDVTSVGNTTSIAAGVIVNADVKSDAAIDYSKLGTIPTWNQDTTGNAATATTAATVTGAAQTAITSVGTLSSLALTGALTVDTTTLKVD